MYRRTTNAGTAKGYSEWPLMELLIVHNTRFVIFVHGDGMDSSCASEVCPEGNFYTFDHFQQTNWNNETCNLQSEVFDPDINFFLMNQDNGGDNALD